MLSWSGSQVKKILNLNAIIPGKKKGLIKKTKKSPFGGPIALFGNIS
jgi:hypothetical protein